MNDEQAEHIGELYAECLKQYDGFGTFQLALSNSMSYRSYNWDIDQFERVLKAIVELDLSKNPPQEEKPDEWREFMENEIS